MGHLTSWGKLLTSFAGRAFQHAPAQGVMCTLLRQILLFALFLPTLAFCGEFEYIGQMKIGCDNPGLEEVFYEPGYPISPADAIEIALQKEIFQCNSKLVQYLYFGNGYYYFAEFFRLQEGEAPPGTVVIDASTGEAVPLN